MAWRWSVGFPILVVSSGLGVGATASRADEAFLCGSDTVVYVKTEELEQKKRTDPCIAGYFGLQVEDAGETAAKRAVKAPVADDKAEPRADEPDRTRAKKAPDSTPREERSATLRPSVPTAGTDFRNVRILNASAEGAQWFKHER